MSRVIVVGLDGATWDVLDPLMGRGVMPNLRRMAAAGARAPLASTLPSWTPPGWTSIATGLNPGNHGILYAAAVVPGEYPGAVIGGVPGRPISALDVHGAPLWRAASAAGRRTCVLLVPLTYPPEPVNGTLVAGMFRPREAADYVHPPAEAAPPGGWRFDPESVLRGGDARHDDPAEVVGELRAITEENARAFEEELSREPWDLFFAVFMAPDRLSHYVWDRLADPDPSDPIDADVIGTFAAIDAFLGRAAEEPDATVVLVSDHGSGSGPVERVNVIRALEEAGLWTPGWDRTSVFPVFSGDLHMVGVAANEAGRWPRGSVPPDRAGETLDAAERALLAVRGEDGAAVVVRVHRHVYRGPFAASFPDRIAELDPRYMATGVSGGPMFEPHRDPSTPWGGHRRDGILLLSGPGVAPGAAIRGTASVEDVAPTVMALLGLAFADPVDGRVLEELLVPGELLMAPRVPSSREGTAAAGVTPGEEAEIEGMLRGLGYVE